MNKELEYCLDILQITKGVHVETDWGKWSYKVIYNSTYIILDLAWMPVPAG